MFVTGRRAQGGKARKEKLLELSREAVVKQWALGCRARWTAVALARCLQIHVWARGRCDRAL